MEGLPLYIQVRNTIREGIEKGAIRPNPDGVLPSQQEFATHLEVGLATVKRAIKDLEHMGLVTSRRGKGLTLNGPVQRYIHEKPDAGAMPSVGIAYFDNAGRLGKPYFNRILSGIEAYSDECRAMLHMISLPGVEVEMQEDTFLSSLSLVNMDGMLVLAPVSSGFVARLMKREIPYVAVNVLADRGEVCHVMDFVSSTFKVVDAVLTRGLRHSLVFLGNESKFSSCLKFFGYKLALAKHGLAPNQDYVAYEDHDSENAVGLIEKILDSGKKLDAVVAYDDITGANIYDFLASRGREDILVAGFGNYEGFEDKIRITTDEKTYEIGYNSLKTLFGMINGIKPERTKFLYDPILIER